jgi:hypothetical protein
MNIDHPSLIQFADFSQIWRLRGYDSTSTDPTVSSRDIGQMISLVLRYSRALVLLSHAADLSPLEWAAIAGDRHRPFETTH